MPRNRSGPATLHFDKLSTGDKLRDPAFNERIVSSSANSKTWHSQGTLSLSKCPAIEGLSLHLQGDSEMAAYVYILECSDGFYYTGSTVDISKRVIEHNQGKGANFTKTRLPVKLVYSRAYATISEAFQREKQIQGWSRKKKRALISGRENELEGH